MNAARAVPVYPRRSGPSRGFCTVGGFDLGAIVSLANSRWPARHVHMSQTICTSYSWLSTTGGVCYTIEVANEFDVTTTLTVTCGGA